MPLDEIFRDSFKSVVAYDRPSWAHDPAEVLVNGHLSFSSADYDPADNEFVPSMIPNVTVDPTNFCAVVHMRATSYTDDLSMRTMAFIYMGVAGPDLDPGPVASVGFKGSPDGSTQPHIFTYNGSEADENPIPVAFLDKDFWLVAHCDGTNLVLDYYERDPYLGADPVATTQSVWDPAAEHAERRFGFEMNGGPGSKVYSWIVYEGQGALPLVPPALVYDDGFVTDTSDDYDKASWTTDPLSISAGKLSVDKALYPNGNEISISPKDLRVAAEEGVVYVIKGRIVSDETFNGYIYPMIGATDPDNDGAWWGGIDVGPPAPDGTYARATAGGDTMSSSSATPVPSPFDGWIVMRVFNEETAYVPTLQGDFNGDVTTRRAGAWSEGYSVQIVAGGAAGTVRYQFLDDTNTVVLETPDFATYQDANAWSNANPDWRVAINVFNIAGSPLPYGPFLFDRRSGVQVELWADHPALGGEPLAECAGRFFSPMQGDRVTLEASGLAGSYIDQVIVYEGVGAVPLPPVPPEPPAPQLPPGGPSPLRFSSIGAGGIRPPSVPLHKRLGQKRREEPRRNK